VRERDHFLILIIAESGVNYGSHTQRHTHTHTHLASPVKSNLNTPPDYKLMG